MHEIRHIGDPVLRTPAEPVTEFDRELRRLIDEMFQVMYAADGVGLAGPQIGVGKRVFVYDIVNRKGHVVNPELTIDDPEQIVAEEGCLSVPSKETGKPLYAPTPRAAGVTLRGFDRLGRPITVKARGMLARCFQHEFDHLNGTLYVDRLPKEERRRILLQTP
ncbi:peptide deformylase [Thermobispora bispora]|uniref:Peptide deformylase n=1 Tax=Thermobispora bispora (strain ATCC 19993 / DSM 43833 / CBS 139.67 / JCM 10125 / KCTC 9307 / NBRC 14880 / R51) TaxID=469371 RepID=D6Y4Q8_THEBD|nr:peptide deformylase [Thermobispora bispora]MBO2475448.1 peptide deformylase [Actinomycetales bacterium]MDI9581076.1 peptide deformylase [Thermobispora sp.]ADG89234.1 peptide deformylase [Thermobispora bispora DSM 43833]MBX6166668.1 peptide deformylase [Thermobispora bispora]QSI48913.1 peptide deformylase [Thermobispora bispora]